MKKFIFTTLVIMAISLTSFGQIESFKDCQKYCFVSDYINGYAWVIVKNLGTFHIDKKGNKVYNQIYLHASDFDSNGWALMLKESIWNKTGKELWVIIDTKGNELSSCRSDDFTEITNYFKKLGYL